MSQRPSILYHFTSRPRWHFIRQVGINCGDTPISLRKALNFPNLTTNPDPIDQKWAGPQPVRKTSVRISVQVSPDDDKLISYRDFADRHGMSRRDYRTLDSVGGWQARYWWIYQGTISPDMFVDVEFLDDDKLTDVERRMLDVFEVSADFEEALGRIGARRVGGFLYVADPLTWDRDPSPMRP